MGIFKACDIRGRYPDELGPTTAGLIGAALGTAGEGGRFVVGGDVRHSTPELKDALCDGLAGVGAEVIDLGVLPTPAVYWAGEELEARGAAIVTASHNPPEYNGVKFMLGHLPPTPEEVRRIGKLVKAADFARAAGSRSRRSVKDHYLRWLRDRYAGTGRGRRVLVDAGNGCASEWAPQAFRDAGYEVEELNCRPDGSFPARSPNPSVAKNLRDTARAVGKADVDFGVAFDGDADRAVFLDERGRTVDTERAIIILARAVLDATPGATVVCDLKCTEKVAEEVERMGGRVVAERSGHAFIKTRLITEKAAFAGEASGHFFFGELGRDDGLYAGLRLGEVLGKAGRRLSEMAASVPDFHISPDIRLERPRGDGDQVIERLKDEFSGYPQEYRDGVRIEFGDGWALCRQSVTEPAITLRFEADTPERLEEIKKMVMDRIPP